MKFVRIGNRIVNPAQITHVEVVEETKRIGVWFVGAQESLDLYGDEATALVKALGAEDSDVPDPPLDRLMEHLDLAKRN
jgi:hypothetical protein